MTLTNRTVLLATHPSPEASVPVTIEQWVTFRPLIESDGTITWQDIEPHTFLIVTSSPIPYLNDHWTSMDGAVGHIRTLAALKRRAEAQAASAATVRRQEIWARLEVEEAGADDLVAIKQSSAWLGLMESMNPTPPSLSAVTKAKDGGPG